MGSTCVEARWFRKEFMMECGLCGKGTSTESCGNTEEEAMEGKRVQESETC